MKEIPLDKLLTETDAPFTFAGNFQSRIKSLEATISGLSVICKTTPSEMKGIVYENLRSIIV
ncbi:hypothetical protein FEF09_09010 [Chitinophaga pinensis]|uniref:Uncharacterized protein n=1 Tax=Chitinophaga pinensis TaxID=79329 RepID=A0A5C6LV26_9BACT|nr:hypothetical protein FEF09_09010 [Chitinophaga pinensis]